VACVEGGVFYDSPEKGEGCWREVLGTGAYDRAKAGGDTRQAS